MFETFLLDSLIRIVLAELSRESILLAVLLVLLIVARLGHMDRR